MVIIMEELTQENFKAKTAEGLSVIDLYAEWCGPCHALSPILEDLSDDYLGINFYKIDIDKAREYAEKKGEVAIADQYGVMSIPTLIFLKDGEEVNRITGLYPKQVYVEALEKFKAS
jgi:thioredoxin 1